MRIVGGRWRGTPLSAPEGRGTRPTTDRTRESMASMVLSAFDLDLSGVRVLDAFAGSGALALEMLSRGAAHVTLVERDRRAAGIVRRNMQALGVTSREADLQVGDAFRLSSSASIGGGPFELVLLDPPYATSAESVSQLVRDLERTGALAPHTVVLYERSADAAGLEVPGLGLRKTKRRGTTATDLMVMETDQTSTEEER